MREGLLKNRVPWSVIVAGLAVFAIEICFAHHDLDFNRPENMGWRWGRSAARRRAPKADILCLGTSMIQTGVLPRVIAHRTGRPAYGMALFASQMPGNYYLFKQALDSGAKPSAVIIDFPVNFLGTSLDAQAGTWPALLNVRETLELAIALRKPRFFAAVVSEKLLPSLSYRLQIRKAFLAALRGESASLMDENLVYMRNYKQNDGAFMNGKRPDYAGEISEKFRNDFLSSDPWRPDPLKSRYFRRLIGLAAANGVRVYWVMTPLVPKLQGSRNVRDLDGLYDTYAYGMISRFPNLTVIDARHSNYPASVFMDAIHLDIDGANALSHTLAEVIDRDKGRSSRWIHLDPFRGRPFVTPIELVVDSHRFIHSGAAVRR